MTEQNIALVRATDIIPFDGVVRPISNVSYLKKNIGLEFSARISDLLKELGIIPPIDYSRITEEGYYDSQVALSSQILKEYLPYVTDYNSMVLFSLNGICPDDNEHGFANNTFSNKKCAIIEPLSEHLDQVVSLVPTDTALKGDVYLSTEAVILIEENYYNSLTDEQKSSLNKLNLTVKTFNGTLKDAINETLTNSQRFTPEVLSLSASDGGVRPSPTSEELKTLITNLCATYGLSQKKYFNLITSVDENMPKYDMVCDEYQNMVNVQEFFMTEFLKELLTKINTP